MQHAQHRAGCRPEDHPRIGRRDLLQVGGMGLLGVGLGDLLRLEAQAANSADVRPASAKSVVFIFQSGGPTQHETFDPKPEAPEMIRGEFAAVQTRLPGVQFCEHLPMLSNRSDRFSVIRTMHHIAGPEFRNEHNSCHYLLHSGSAALPAGDTNASIALPRPGRMAWPSIGSMIAYAAPPIATATGLPAAVELPRGNRMKYPGRDSGLLGPLYDRFGVDLAPKCNAEGGSCPNCFRHADPNLDPSRLPDRPNAWWDHSSCRNPDFHLPDMALASGISLARLENRGKLLRRLDQLRAGLDRAEQAGTLTAWDAHRLQAQRFVLATRPGRHNPFDLTHESDQVRDRYGREEWGRRS